LNHGVVITALGVGIDRARVAERIPAPGAKMIARREDDDEAPPRRAARRVCSPTRIVAPRDMMSAHRRSRLAPGSTQARWHRRRVNVSAGRR
jgi:hypothetical protein